MSRRRATLIGFFAGVVVLFLLLGVEVALDRPIYFWLAGLDVGTVSSPGRRYRLHYTVDPNQFGVSYGVYISRRWWLFPKRLGEFQPYSLTPNPLFDDLPPGGIRGPLRASVFWSRGERYVALSEKTWFCHLVDLSTGSQRHFEPERGWIIGETPQQSIDENPKLAEWKKFHEEVQRLLDSDGGAVEQR